jgi:hypothetical protein
VRPEWTEKWCNSINGGDDVTLIVTVILQYYIFANKEKNIENEPSLCEGQKLK